ncbi:MAG: hypothetical protein Q4G16_06520 [Cruoricaptor ignavus]|nr:hypothetical protein [Cruoricaptor ignavus]
MKTLSTLFTLFIGISTTFAQYVEPEKSVKEAEKRKASQVVTHPKQKFDSIQTKNALAIGKGKIQGVAFTRTKNGYGMKVGKKVLANKVLIQLFPVTPYFEEYYKLWKDKSLNNPKKNKYVYMHNNAYKYRLEAISNSSGEFTFPDMRPGKYYLWATLNYSLTHKYNRYTGSSYGSYGSRVDYYRPEQYSVGHSDFLELFVEVKEDGEVVTVKLK